MIVSTLSINISLSNLPVNTFVYSRAVIQGVSIRTGLDKHPVYMAIKLLWLKPDKYYVTWKGSHLISAQSSITEYTALDTLLSTLILLTLDNKFNEFMAKFVYKCHLCMYLIITTNCCGFLTSATSKYRRCED